MDHATAAGPNTPVGPATGVGSAAACTSGGMRCEAAGRNTPAAASKSITVDITPGHNVQTKMARSASSVSSGSREARRVRVLNPA